MQANLISELFEATELIKETREQLGVIHNMLASLPEKLGDEKPLKLKRRIMTDKLNNYYNNINTVQNNYKSGKISGHEYINKLVTITNNIITEFEEK